MESNNNVSDYLSSSPTATLYAEDIEKLQKFIDDSQKKLNIMVMGQAGVGKSTLINAVVRKEVAQTGIGRPVTTEIAEYSGSGYSFFDTAGIELDPTQQKNTIHSICAFIRERSQKDISSQIHMIWYCIDAAGRRVQPIEWELLRQVSHAIKESNIAIPVVFIITKPYGLSPVDLEHFTNAIKEDAGAIFPDSAECILPVQSIPYTLTFMGQELTFPVSGLKELDDLVEKLLPAALKAGWISKFSIDVKKKVKLAKKVLAKDAVAVAGLAVGSAVTGIDDSLGLIAAEVYLCAKIGNIFNFRFDQNKVYSTVVGGLGIAGVSAVGKSIFSWLMRVITGGASMLIEAGIRVSVAEAMLTPFGMAYIKLMERFALGEINESEVTAKMTEMMSNDIKNKKES